MPRVTVGRENSADIEIHYEDHGAGRPVVLIHGYPLSGRAWDKQVSVLLQAGYRVITYDRRGFGRSSQPVVGYDYDTFAADLDRLLDGLDVGEAVLVGHSMGTGEVARYLAAHGSDRVAKAVLVSPIPPFLLQSADNPDGVPQSVFDGFVGAAQSDLPAWMKGFLDNFYNFDTLGGTLVSDAAYRASWNIAVGASAAAAVACIGPLEFAQSPLGLVVVGKLVVGEDTAGRNIGSHVVAPHRLSCGRQVAVSLVLISRSRFSSRFAPVGVPGRSSVKASDIPAPAELCGGPFVS